MRQLGKHRQGTSRSFLSHKHCVRLCKILDVQAHKVMISINSFVGIARAEGASMDWLLSFMCILVPLSVRNRWCNHLCVASLAAGTLIGRHFAFSLTVSCLVFLWENDEQPNKFAQVPTYLTKVDLKLSDMSELILTYVFHFSLFKNFVFLDNPHELAL